MKINNVVKLYSSLSYDKSANEVWNFSIVLPDYDANDSDIDIGKVVEIYRDGTPAQWVASPESYKVFKGYITNLDVSFGEEANPVTVSGRSNHDKLICLVMSEGDQTDEPSTLVEDALDGTFTSPAYSDSGITKNLGTWKGYAQWYSYGADVNIHMDYQDRWSYIKQVSELIGFNALVRPNDKLSFGTNIGGLLYGSPDYITFEPGVNCYMVRKSVDGTQIANRIYAIGSGVSEDWRVILDVGVAPPYVEEGNTSDPLSSRQLYGLHETTIVEPNIDWDTELTSADTLEARANAYLNAYKTPITSVTITPMAHKYTGYWCEVHDDVHIVDPETNLNNYFRINRINVSYDVGGGENMSMEVSNRARSLPDVITDIGSWLTKQRNPQINTRSPTTGSPGNNNIIYPVSADGIITCAPSHVDGCYETKVRVGATYSGTAVNGWYRIFYKIYDVEHNVVKSNFRIGTNMPLDVTYNIRTDQTTSYNDTYVQLWGFRTYQDNSTNPLSMSTMDINVVSTGYHSH